MNKLFPAIALITAAATIIFTLYYRASGSPAALTLAISFCTTCYHFAMRLILGLLFRRLIRKPLDYRQGWFTQKSWEPRLYRALKVKGWKNAMPTYYPEDFSLKKHTVPELIQTMCISELGHEFMMLFSFLPLFLAVPFGELPVFLITSVLAACVDLIFVILQRYNRPRLVRMMNRTARRA